MPAQRAPVAEPPKRRVRPVYVRVEVSVADGIIEAAERCGVSISRAWERAGERYLIEHFGRADTAAPSLP